MPKRKKNRSESSRVCIKKKICGCVYVMKLDTGGEGKGGHRMYEI